MSIYYLDASALVKRYVNETGSAWLRSLLSSPQVQLAFTSRMTVIEVLSAFARRLREGSLTPEEFAAAASAYTTIRSCLPRWRLLTWPARCWSVIRCVPTTRPTWLLH